MKNNSLTLIFGSLAAVSATAIGFSGSAEAAAVVNGGFESGLAGWNVVQQVDFGSNWFQTPGWASPLSGLSIPDPTEGSAYAVTDQFVSGSQVLFQDIFLETGLTHTLSFDWFAQDVNGAGGAGPIDNGTLSFVNGPNQHFRVDLVQAGFTDWFGSSGAGLLANILAPSAEAPPVREFTSKTFNLTPWAGTTVRLAYRQVSNQDNFQAGVDDVSISSVGSQPIPTPALLPGLIGMGVAALRKKGRKEEVVGQEA